MQDKLTELAILFKERDNSKGFDISTAIVVSTTPLVLKMSEKIFLSKEYNNLVLTTATSNLNLSDEVLVCPIFNGQIWYAIDKVVRL